jgi:hypothetical protein
VAALPKILHELKARGYRIVHVVPASPELPATPTEAPQWQLHPLSESVAISHWPKIPGFVFSAEAPLPVPSLSDLDWDNGGSMTLVEQDQVRRLARGVPLPRQAPWPRPSPLPQADAAIALPIPAQSIFQIGEGLRAVMQSAPTARRAELSAAAARDETISDDAGNSRRTIRSKPGSGNAHKAAGHATRHAAHTRRGTLKHLVQVKRGSV